jgi:sarcosine oxidase subunit beta
MRSQALWRELQADTGRDFEWIVSGNLRLAYSADILEALRTEQAQEREDGLETEIWTGDELRRRISGIAPEVIGAKYCASDGHANPILATWMIVSAARGHGVQYLTGCEAEAVGTRAGAVESVVARHPVHGSMEIRASTVVHAAGAWTRELAKDLGVVLPLSPARNAMMITEALPPMFTEFLSSHEKQVYLRQAAKGQVHIGGVFTVPGTFDQTVTTDELERLARAAEILPSLSDALVLRSWAGTLDYTPDHKPLVGAISEIGGYVVAAGFSGHGFCLGPVIGEAVANLILGQEARVSLSELDPMRFAGAA